MTRRNRNQDEEGLAWQKSAMTHLESKVIADDKKFLYKLMILEEGYGVDVAAYRSKLPLKYDLLDTQEGI